MSENGGVWQAGEGLARREILQQHLSKDFAGLLGGERRLQLEGHLVKYPKISG